MIDLEFIEMILSDEGFTVKEIGSSMISLKNISIEFSLDDPMDSIVVDFYLNNKKELQLSLYYSIDVETIASLIKSSILLLNDTVKGDRAPITSLDYSKDFSKDLIFYSNLSGSNDTIKVNQLDTEICFLTFKGELNFDILVKDSSLMITASRSNLSPSHIMASDLIRGCFPNPYLIELTSKLIKFYN